MSNEQAAMICAFVAGAALLIAQSSVGAPISGVLTLIAGVVNLGATIFFGAKVAAGSQRVQAAFVRVGLKKASVQ